MSQLSLQSVARGHRLVNWCQLGQTIWWCQLDQTIWWCQLGRMDKDLACMMPRAGHYLSTSHGSITLAILTFHGITLVTTTLSGITLSPITMTGITMATITLSWRYHSHYCPVKHYLVHYYHAPCTMHPTSHPITGWHPFIATQYSLYKPDSS